jgi:hypothetical protein
MSRLSLSGGVECCWYDCVVSWDRSSTLCPTKGARDCGGALDVGPCAYLHCDSPEVPDRLGDWVSERKSTIAAARLSGKECNFTGEHLWARGYAVSTVGFELEQVRRCIRDLLRCAVVRERIAVNAIAPALIETEMSNGNPRLGRRFGRSVPKPQMADV